ncbi:MAG TPA: hypothetical protein VF530_09120 [Planctomycetota bacterium]
MGASASVTLSLTPDQALVFFDWLSRSDDRSALPIAHPAEQRVLWALEAQLDRALVEPFQAEYAARVAAARERIAQE